MSTSADPPRSRRIQAERAVLDQYNGAATWQALAVAAVCVAADMCGMLLTWDHTVGLLWVVLPLVVLADLLLAAPPRWSMEVAIAHAVMAAAVPLMVPSQASATDANNAGLIVAAFLAGSWLRTRSAFVALAFLMAGLAVHPWLGAGEDADWRLVAVVTVTSCLLPWLVGRFTMARRRYIDELEQHAERLRRDEQAAVQRAVLRERTALARDLHDVISHHVSTIGMHAGAARMSLADPAPAVHRSLSAVESSSRAAMVDLRRLLDVLHGGGPGAAHRQPGLDNIDDLLDGVRAAGLPVRLAAHGRRRELTGSVDMAVYRAVQEALTNAVRHGDGAGADVELRYRDDGVGVVVTNGMDAARLRFGARGAGRGLAGLRQRVALFGGTVRYGPERGGRTWRFEADFTDRAEELP